MNMEIRFPQLEELLDWDAEVRDLIEALNDKLAALNSKIDALAPAVAAPAPTPIDPPLSESEPKPAPKKRGRPSKVKASTGNGEDHADEDVNNEDDLRARVTFEAKRVTRTLGIGGMRAAIRKATGGANILQVDDVPASKLPLLLTELQAM
jgi:hypothetical protein